MAGGCRFHVENKDTETVEIKQVDNLMTSETQIANGFKFHIKWEIMQAIYAKVSNLITK